jgi:hypothetical protein
MVWHPSINFVDASKEELNGRLRHSGAILVAPGQTPKFFVNQGGQLVERRHCPKPLITQ